MMKHEDGSTKGGGGPSLFMLGLMDLRDRAVEAFSGTTHARAVAPPVLELWALLALPDVAAQPLEELRMVASALRKHRALDSIQPEVLAEAVQQLSQLREDGHAQRLNLFLLQMRRLVAEHENRTTLARNGVTVNWRPDGSQTPQGQHRSPVWPDSEGFERTEPLRATAANDGTFVELPPSGDDEPEAA